MPPTKYQTYGKKYYEANKAKCVERNRAVQERYKQEWHDYKASLSCEHCGESHPAIIDFHHTDPNDPKKRHVNALIKNRRYKEAYIEINERCIILCANCHRKLHYNEHANKKDPPPPLTSLEK